MLKDINASKKNSITILLTIYTHTYIGNKSDIFSFNARDLILTVTFHFTR